VEMGTGPRIVVADDAATGAAEAARQIAEALAAAARTRDRVNFATTGGSAAPALYRGLLAAGTRDVVPWSCLHVWWGDDRFVTRGEPDSNVTALDEVLLRGDAGTGVDPAPLAADQVHPIPVAATLATGGDAAAAAAAYAGEIAAAVPLQDGVPVFDVVVVGVGPDGHLLSVFPGSAVFDADPAAIALAVPPPIHIGPHVARVTLHPAIVDAARALFVIAFGAAKADVLARLLAPEGDDRALPARLARRPGATWILDRAAAAGLPLED
jgi:6-phosphogluconolactonase